MRTAFHFTAQVYVILQELNLAYDLSMRMYALFSAASFLWSFSATMFVDERDISPVRTFPLTPTSSQLSTLSIQQVLKVLWFSYSLHCISTLLQNLTCYRFSGCSGFFHWFSLWYIWQAEGFRANKKVRLRLKACNSCWSWWFDRLLCGSNPRDWPADKVGCIECKTNINFDCYHKLW